MSDPVGDRAGDRTDPPPTETLAIVLVNWNTEVLLRRALLSIRRHPAPLPTAVHVVDNASTDGSVAMVQAEFPEVHLHALDRNLGFSAGNNVALRAILADPYPADWVLLLNPDAEVLPETLARSIEAARARPCTVAVRLLNSDGTLQPSAFRFPALLRDLAHALWLPRLFPPRIRGRIFLAGAWDHAESRVVDWAIGAYLLVPRKALEEVGLLPEEYPIFGEDLEWCHRLWEGGFPVYFLAGAEAIHHGNQAAGQLPSPWRIRRTFAASDRYMRERHGRLRAALYRGILLLNFLLRASVFTILALWIPARIGPAQSYRTILGTLLTSSRDDVRAL